MDSKQTKERELNIKTKTGLLPTPASLADVCPLTDLLTGDFLDLDLKTRHLRSPRTRHVTMTNDLTQDKDESV